MLPTDTLNLTALWYGVTDGLQSITTATTNSTGRGNPTDTEREGIMVIHKFRKTSEGAYLFPVYIRDDGKYKITSTDRCIFGAWKRVFEVTNEAGEIVGTFPRLRDAKISYEAETEKGRRF